MEENSIKQCKYIAEAYLNKLGKAFTRIAVHTTLITDLMDPSHKIGKALRSIEWLDESALSNYELNAYSTGPGPWATVKKALEKAHIDDGALSYVTLIPGKLELHNAMDELILEFASEEDYYRLITQLKLIICED